MLYYITLRKYVRRNKVETILGGNTVVYYEANGYRTLVLDLPDNKYPDIASVGSKLTKNGEKDYIEIHDCLIVKVTTSSKYSAKDVSDYIQTSASRVGMLVKTCPSHHDMGNLVTKTLIKTRNRLEYNRALEFAKKLAKSDIVLDVSIY